MLIAVGATCRRPAAAVALPASKASQKYLSCLRFIFYEPVVRNRCLLTVHLWGDKVAAAQREARQMIDKPKMQALPPEVRTLSTAEISDALDALRLPGSALGIGNIAGG